MMKSFFKNVTRVERDSQESTLLSGTVVCVCGGQGDFRGPPLGRKIKSKTLNSGCPSITIRIKNNYKMITLMINGNKL